MAFPWEPPRYSPKGLENQYINSVFQIHDSICGCPEPILHLLRVWSDRNNLRGPKITDQDLRDIKWRLTGEGRDGGPPNIVAEDGPDSFDLEQLFADDGEPAAGNAGEDR